MPFPQWMIDSLKNSEQVIAFLNPGDFNDTNISIIKNKIIDVVGNASQVYIYLEFKSDNNIEQNKIIFASPKDTEVKYKTIAVSDQKPPNKRT